MKYCYTWLLLSVFVHSCFGDLNINDVIGLIEGVIGTLPVSAECNRSLTMYVDNVVTGDDDAWGMRMLDATSKIPVGLLFAMNVGELGNFDECLATKSKDGLIKAKYCLGSLSLEGLPQNINPQSTLLQQQINLQETAARTVGLKVRDGNIAISGATWAICLPSDCTDEDAVIILSTLVGSSGALCQTEEDLHPPLTGKAIAAIVILGFIAFVMVASTSYDLYCKFYHKVPGSMLYIAFSTYSNGKKLFKINKSSTELSCMNGIRFLSMLWVIIGHVFTLTLNFPVSNLRDILDYFDTRASMIIVSGTLSVDSFLVMSGVLVAYVFMKARLNGMKFNIFQFYIHRYLRLTPCLAAAVLVTATLLEYMGTGPKWSSVKTSLQEPCQKYWWSALLYVQNYVNFDEMCLSHTWYLSVDMQLYLIAPLVLLPLLKYTKIGLGLVVACIFAFIVTPFCIAYERELSGMITNIYALADLVDYMRNYYFTTHTRAAPWFMGILLGYALATIRFKRKPEDGPLRINQVLATLVWLACFVMLLVCVFCGFDTLRGPEYYRVSNAFYIALIRPLWALCLAWIIFACVTGYGGPINWILSFPIYQVLNRFTYSLYIVHYPIIAMIALAAKESVRFSTFNMGYSFWGLFMFSMGLSLLWILAFESPVIIIEKFLFKNVGKLMDSIGRLCRRPEKNTKSSSAAATLP